ncbi:cell division ATP-binding protein FtsE [Lactococcus paracarnosus]|uniref:ATP-binding cassette domain-containing protein n=1 Tax=Pseudolactococcus paracarnosus TaxID=2749962 RepID=A0A7L4WAD8_9LACT|nr:ATP-binding cassette domain-containing protein [Lactococcus paracarnosus]SPC38025.1 Cell division ATP-binding protein FtsE [Lactococcus piscium]MCJ1978379.1 ATP-binding cassette domain-containing protein [Lactococcus paracarnosus]MCJ1984528.1 ATP-binding cassette domain-containing protein [Lactococcus paracarnosus]MCJ1994461.1 ATP-binding cassette domain-containing protein [Lactococcus paracarnosus]MCJ1998975.1 ATP-binding cassette domain-containing protein [Lactococcus paracarnosus]
MIQFENVTLKRKDVLVLRDISMQIQDGEFAYLVGNSGSGKSSIHQLIYGNFLGYEGTIKINGQDIQLLDFENLQYTRQKIGIIFQDYKLIADKTVFENISYRLGFSENKKDVKKIVHYWAKRLKIAQYLAEYPSNISGGEQQRVAIARAIVDKPSIILADEPTANLDPQNAVNVMAILTELNHKGTTIIMTTHNTGIKCKYQYRTIFLADGKIVND